MRVGKIVQLILDVWVLLQFLQSFFLLPSLLQASSESYSVEKHIWSKYVKINISMSLPKKLQFFSPLKLATVALSGGENNRKMPEKCIFPSNFAATITTWYKHKKILFLLKTMRLHGGIASGLGTSIKYITTIIPPCFWQ